MQYLHSSTADLGGLGYQGFALAEGRKKHVKLLQHNRAVQRNRERGK